VIDFVWELEAWLSLLSVLFAVLATPVVAGFFLGRALPIPIGTAIFGVGTAILALLAYREYQYHVDYCRDSPEVRAGGDELSCLEPYNWFAIHLEALVFLAAELGLATILVGGVVRWRNSNRSKPRPFREGPALIQRTR
jgi:hypothetical protein